MRTRFLAVVIIVLVACSAGSTSAQQPQAATLLAQSAAALSGSGTVADVTLNGTAQSIAGSDDETGTVVLKAMACRSPNRCAGIKRISFHLT
jgi:uncharacterized membrane protein